MRLGNKSSLICLTTNKNWFSFLFSCYSNDPVLVVWVPVSFLLPTLAHRPPSYYRGRSSRGRNHQLERQLDDNNIIDDDDKLPVEKTTKNGYNPQSSDYKFESHYGPLLSRLEAYFSLMKIDSIHCRWKLTCYASKEPDRYQPLSNLFRRLFERSSKSSAAKSINQQHYHPALKKFFTYVWADKKGSRFKSVEQCDTEYSMCPTPVHRLIRMDMIRFWQKLSKRFAIQLQDEWDGVKRDTSPSIHPHSSHHFASTVQHIFAFLSILAFRLPFFVTPSWDYFHNFI